MQLSSEQLAVYREQGFIHFRSFFDPRVVAAVREEARRVFVTQLRALGILRTTTPSEAEIDDGMAELFRDHLSTFINCGKQAQHLVSLHRLSLNEKLIEVVRQMGVEWPNICTRPVMFFNSPRLAKSEVYWRVFPHQDWRSMQGSLDSVVAWAPLADLTPELGPLEVIPGSHLDGLVTSEVVEGFGKVDDAYLQDKAFVSLPCSLGDVVLFSSFLIHRSGTNSSPGIRWSCHFRYNNLAETTFVERGYPHPYLYKPSEDLLTPGFPAQPQVREVFRRAA
jgi:ectoine hydroxylase-related dioxygenase (phytanoyl-CoA dioxygenase family)